MIYPAYAGWIFIIMTTDELFRIAYWIVFAGMVLIQSYYALILRSRSKDHPSDADAERANEGAIQILRFIRTILLVVFLILYAIQHPMLETFYFDIPIILQVFGLALGIGSLLLYVWARVSLGPQWSSKIQRSAQPRLVIEGPYARIRHPVYTAMIGFLSSLTLLAANGLMLIILILSIEDLVIRIAREEQLLLKSLGKNYKDYMQVTGSLLPRFRNSNQQKSNHTGDKPF
jgi:protein-S-isoprenylcysteine O-methyltransferase Ste14